MKRSFLCCLALAISGCAHSTSKPSTPDRAPKLNEVHRMDFNRIAADLALPLFWRADANRDGAIQPDELAVYWGLVPGVSLGAYVQQGRFTPKFLAAYHAIATWVPPPEGLPRALAAQEKLRRTLVVKELEQSRPTLVESDLAGAKGYEKAFVQTIEQVGAIIEQLYSEQMGMAKLRARIPSNDPASHALFYRNQDFRCEAPKTQSNPACSAIPDPPSGKVSGLYPEAALQQEGFCEKITHDPKLGSPFTVIRQDASGKLVAVPYAKAYASQMEQVSALLKQAAALFPKGVEEPLRAYLLADAKAFTDGSWFDADEAWAKMNATDSKWYVRIAPDEVYAEPCSTKALFQVSFGRIDPGSLHWQKVLTPMENEMEAAFAKLAGPPYQAHPVSFHLPDFFDVMLNAGDARAPTGATVGESLPNFGPVANQGRGRTVAMINFYTDPDSLATLRSEGESLFCKSVMPHFTTSPSPQLMSTVLHEASHNLGPAHQYAVNGKTDVEVFGGPLASTLEELKAQTGALFFTDWLAAKGKISAEDAARAHVRDVMWAFGHISRGMFDSAHHPRTYSQLAAVQVGYLLDHGGLAWKPDALAANGEDRGCFAFDFPRFATTVDQMGHLVAGIKARGDLPAAQTLLNRYVNVTGARKALRETITERMLRSPKQSFVYAIEY